jgi:hypothetical protein
MNYWQDRTGIDTSYFVSQTFDLEPLIQSGVMVLEEDPSPYLTHSLDGPFLNFHMSASYLKQEKTLQQKAQVFQMIRRQLPAQVYDNQGHFKALLEELPVLKEFYTEEKPGRYSKK